MSTVLHTYQCSNCRSSAVATFRGIVKCPLCFRILRFVCSDPIVTARQREWARHGVVLNPGLTTCDVCGQRATPPTRVRTSAGLFCSEACATVTA